MRIIILGASGLIGHTLLREFSLHFEVFGTLHKSKKQYGNIQLFSGRNIIESLDISEFEKLKGVLLAIDPDVVLNCVGITKRKNEINNLVKTVEINSIFPHKLAEWAVENRKRIIHFSTDCVFDGTAGNYSEESLTTAQDIYGRTKAMGEIRGKSSLTIRSSFIGQELFGKTELLEWFLSQNGKQVTGFTNTFYSGVSTVYMTNVVKQIIVSHPNLEGLFQLAPEHPVSKYELLCIAKRVFDLDVTIIPDKKQVHNPTLNGSKLRSIMQLKEPSWEEMMKKLFDNRDFYI